MMQSASERFKSARLAAEQQRTELMQARTKEVLLDAYWNSVPDAIKRPIHWTRAKWWKAIGNVRHFEYEHRRELMRRVFTALRFNAIDGAYAEFGCHGGMTFALAYRESRKIGYDCPMWAFDSFRGLPPKSLSQDEHPAWIEGALKTSLPRFHRMCRLAGMKHEEYRVVPGFYQDTLNVGNFHQDMPERISFAYVDCDLYTSAKSVMRFLASRIRHGTVVAFDDYFCFAENALAGERLACAEFLKENGTFIFSPYCQFGWHGMSFIAEDKIYWKRHDRSLLREVSF